MENRHQCKEQTTSQRLFSLEEKRSTVCGPHLMSSKSKYERQMDQSSGMYILEISLAKTLGSGETHSTEVIILRKRQNQRRLQTKTC